MRTEKYSKDYHCWLAYDRIKDEDKLIMYKKITGKIFIPGDSLIIKSAEEELNRGIIGITGFSPELNKSEYKDCTLLVIKANENYSSGVFTEDELEILSEEGYLIKSLARNKKEQIIIGARTDRGILYGVFRFLNLLQMEEDINNVSLLSNPSNNIRIINHWDNLDGSIERGYAGKSIFYKDNQLTDNLDRVKDYARLLSSIGINSIAINNVNVHYEETRLISDKIDMVKTLAGLFRNYGIKTFLSVNYASPIQLSAIETADPLDEGVRQWWKDKVVEIYQNIPDFGGFLVKADSENRPGPFTYNRNHADGANMLAEALEPFGGIVIWRCFVYNCQQDWRDYETDRARAAYDNFMPLDGKFKQNVVLQIKNGPMDFQVREPVSPLFGGLGKTNQILELQITQEYTGQQKHLCYLVPLWKEVLEFETFARGEGSTVKRIVDGSLIPQKYSGFASVVNVGNDENWTGHTLAQANLHGYGRLAWNPDLSAKELAEEWISLTFANDEKVVSKISKMLLDSWEIYENYTSPLGIGWMVNPNHHYGPNVDGYEYSRWGTYHRADHFGIGVDRTVEHGTGYVGQYYPENAVRYESLEKCPDELLLFFHHVPYTYKLDSGKTVLQHIYDTHFRGVEQVKELIEHWKSLDGRIDDETFNHVLARLNIQLEHSKEWRDVINTYFYRKTGIADEHGRNIYA
ncbi:MAG: alpha-glucuronidase family glycosyl hydrolase [Halanaerobiales bacterium]